MYYVHNVMRLLLSLNFFFGNKDAKNTKKFNENNSIYHCQAAKRKI